MLRAVGPVPIARERLQCFTLLVDVPYRSPPTNPQRDSSSRQSRNSLLSFLKENAGSYQKTTALECRLSQNPITISLKKEFRNTVMERRKLSAEQLVKIYRGRQAVKGVSLEVEQGSIVGLLGPNGAGKTTTFYMIAGVVRPDRGTIYLDEAEITHYPMHKRARCGIGYLSQERSIFRKLTVEDNLMAILELLPISKAERKERLEMLLEELGIAHVRHLKGYALSGGESRRTEIARALVLEPSIILLDEPFAGVDPIAVADIQETVRQLARRNIGVLITDHNVRETFGIIDRGYIMNEGTLLVSGTPEELSKDEQARKVYLGESFAF